MLEISSYLRKYQVHFSDKLSEVFTKDKIQDSFFIIDQNVYRLYQTSFSSIPKDKVIYIDAVEENKSYEKITSLLLELVNRNIKKNQKLVVIGGGITQDIGCFIAHIYRRGLGWEFYPTTLLAQADSCIGSKSSINIGSFKNQIGTFYPPSTVTIILEFLNTLKREDICSGIGEIIKLALIDGEATVTKTKSLLQKSREDQTIFSVLLQQSLHIKKKFIEEDEFDVGVRNILNLGHTFGHAFESASNFSIPHGIAVLIGLHAACFFSEKLENIPIGSYSEFMNWSKVYVGVFDKTLRSLELNAIVEAFRSDKKNTGNKIKFILPHDSLFGNYKIIPLELDSKIISLLQEFIENY